MKILTIITSQYGYDGISNVAYNYYRYKNKKHLNEDWIVINDIPDDIIRLFRTNHDRIFILPYRNSNPGKYIVKLWQIIRKGQYDVVHAHGNSSTLFVEMLASKIAGVKVRIPHSHNTKCDHGIIHTFLKPFFLRSYSHAFACGKEAGEWLFGNKPFDVISNGVDLDFFEFNENTRNQLRKKHQLEDKFVIGHVGRFSQQKNHKKLIDIYEEVLHSNPESILVLVGDGNLRGEIEEDVIRRGLNVLFVGNSNDVNNWLQVFDVFVMPSLFEGLPLVLVEAQASGLPCVISDTISSSVNISKTVRFTSLRDSLSRWANTILDSRVSDREASREIIKEHITKAHFDIKQNCIEIVKKYEKFVLKES